MFRCALGPPGASALARWPGIAQLVTLNCGECEFGERCVQNIFAASAGSLRYLGVYGHNFNKAVRERLGMQFGRRIRF